MKNETKYNLLPGWEKTLKPGTLEEGTEREKEHVEFPLAERVKRVSLLTSLRTMFVVRSGKIPSPTAIIYTSTPSSVGFGLSVLALLAGFVFHSKLMALGGPHRCVTPGSDLPIIVLD
jgi:hypothetical protein